MHAYLLIGKETKKSIESLVTKLKGTPLNFPITKIEDVRQLSNFLKLSQKENTIIVSEDIDESTPQALNAFLKNLEEPQANVKFILTATNEHKILPTILSRCQIIRDTKNNNKESMEIINNFLDSGVGKRLATVDKIKTRPDALKFTKDLISELHLMLGKNSTNYKNISDNLEVSQNTLTSLEANGNVNLQLTNLVVNLTRV